MMIFQTVYRNLIRRSNNDAESPSLDRLLAQFDRELENFTTLVQPAAESLPRTPFDSDLPREKMSLANMSLRQRLSALPVMLPLLRQMQRSARMYDGRFQPTRSTAPAAFLKEIEEMAYVAGAKDLKFVKVPPQAIFKHKGIPHDYALVYTVEMDQEIMSTAPSFSAFKEVAQGYKRLAVIGNKLAGRMRAQGFAAYPGTALGGLTDYCYLAEVAGLGAIGYHGLLITPEEGARLRINTIYTNITNLPLETDNEHLWVRDFCAMCRKCIRECPPQAIFDQPRPRSDGGWQCIDHGLCRDTFQQNFGCAICLAVCPFSQAGYHKVQSHFKGNPRAPQFHIPERNGKALNN